MRDLIKRLKDLEEAAKPKKKIDIRSVDPEAGTFVVKIDGVVYDGKVDKAVWMRAMSERTKWKAFAILKKHGQIEKRAK